MDSIEDTYDIKTRVLKLIDQRIQQTKEKYKGLNIPLTGRIENPIKQSNPKDTFTCLVSSAINTMKAMGIEPKTEDEFLELIDSRDDNREVRLSDVMDVLRTEGCLVEFASDNPDRIVDGLRDGAVQW